jgi:glyceraldehyde-3-phosphate dehydrogenase/erythrose-4-phosphate dehydrogenase
MTYRIAINGYGRIGRCVLRAFYESTDYADMRLVAINDLADIANLSHLTRYDSTHGRFQGTVETSNETSEKHLIVNGDKIRVFNEPDVGKLPWSDLDVDLVMECSGAFKDR